MTLTQLGYIVAVDKFKNFGQAAQSCKVTQPTLSMQIQKLEEEMGLILFDRSEQPIKTTKVGESLIRQARNILREADRYQEIVTEEKDQTKGQIKIGVIPTLAPYLMPLFLRQFVISHPNVRMVIEELQTNQIVSKLEDGDLDLGLLVTPIEHSALKSDALFYEPFLAYVSEKSPLFKQSKIDQKELNSNDLWLLTEGHCFREQSLLICKNRKKSTDQNKSLLFESGSLETLKRMIDQENGFTLLPFLATLDIKNNKRLKEFSGPTPSREVSVIYSEYFRKDKIKNDLIQAIQASLPPEIQLVSTKKIQVLDLPSGHQFDSKK